MKFRKSYRFTIFIAFCIFGFLLTSCYAAFVYFSSAYFEKDMVNIWLTEETDFFMNSYVENRTPIVSHYTFTSYYVGEEALPTYFRKFVKDLPEGFYQTIITNNNGKKMKYFLSIKQMKERNIYFYVIHNLTKMEEITKRQWHLVMTLFFGFVAILILSLCIGLFTSHLLIAPLQKLYHYFEKSNPENLPINISEGFKDDEVGRLAKALEVSMKRIHKFIEREKQFTRDASHELRTPLTIIKGATELLQHLPTEEFGESKIKKPLDRIERSVKDMETTIETFLWLAREEKELTPFTPCNVTDVVKNAIEENAYLLTGKDIDVSVKSDHQADLNISKPLLKIAVTNLIRNAFHYTLSGTVKIRIEKDYIEVSDTGAGIKSEDLEMITQPHIKGKSSKGFGLGLAIVEQLCDRFSWQLEIESCAGKGTKARLIFQ